MKKILLCGSIKYRDYIEQAFKELKNKDFLPLFPDGKTITKHLSEAEHKAAMAHEHYTAMRKADAVYFVLPKGYMGTSGKIELGYAAALGKPIFFSEKTDDFALDHYPLAFIALGDLEQISTMLH